MDGHDTYDRKQRMHVFLALLLIIGNVFAASECDITLSIGDWRAVAAVVMMLSAVLVAAMYMYGSIFDDSFTMKAKSEIFQLVVTAVILLTVVGIVQFMCSPAIPALVGYDAPNAYNEANHYLSRLSNYTFTSFFVVGTVTGIVSTVSGMNIIGKGTDVLKIDTNAIKGRFGQGFLTSLSMLKESMNALIGTVIVAYLALLLQIQILKFIPIFTLTVLLPAGLILRGFFQYGSLAVR